MNRNLKTVALAILVVVLVSLIYTKFFRGLVLVRSNVDGREYLVRNMPDKQDASDRLASLCKKLNEFIDVLGQEYPNDSRIKRIQENFVCHTVHEGDGFLDTTSYTTDKEHITLCLRNENDYALHSENVLMFVFIHEIAHVGNHSYGHDENWRKFFVFLLEEAEARGYYQYHDFEQMPVEYCGMMVQQNIN